MSLTTGLQYNYLESEGKLIIYCKNISNKEITIFLKLTEKSFGQTNSIPIFQRYFILDPMCCKEFNYTFKKINFFEVQVAFSELSKTICSVSLLDKTGIQYEEYKLYKSSK
ncbi:hypothetical protein [Paenibacillus amylolyticus]|uniref:hypothetical protein n=1 Tax=Paenibacillus amylolyticus TaxID=1451 RepID=UPI0039AF9384